MSKKPGRNDPCPCGSGQKYKRCCMTAGESTVIPPVNEAPPIFPWEEVPDARKIIEYLDRRQAESELEDEDEEDDLFEPIDLDEEDDLFEPIDLDEVVMNRPLTPLEEAQELLEQAWAEEDAAARVRVAREALEISPDCVEAYVVLGEEADTREEALAWFRQGVQVGERLLGDDAGKPQGAFFWNIVEPDPYLLARAGVARVLWETGEQQDGIAEWEEILRLNPDDNVGVIYPLLAALVARGDQRRFEELSERYDDGVGASFAYAHALLAFKQHGPSEAADTALRRALVVNPDVPSHLLGRDDLDPEDEEFLALYFEEDEAVICAREQQSVWSQTPGALAWLDQQSAE